MGKINILTSYLNEIGRDIFVRKNFNLLFWRFSRLAQLLTAKSGVYDNFILNLCKILDKKVSLPEPILLDREEIKQCVENLKDKGYFVFPKRLSKNQINDILNYAYSIKPYVGNKRCDFFVSPDNIPNEYPRYIWKMEDLIKNKTIQNILFDSTFALIAQEYFGCRPILSMLTLWLDTVYEGEVSSHIFHCDADSPKYLKFFFYLTDVDIESGAHVYIQKTHSHKRNHPFYKMTRYSEEELLNYFGKENKIVFEASAGSIIAEDTHGFHRGTTPKKSHRFLLELQFSIIDSYNYDYEREGLKINRIKVPNLDKNLKSIYRKIFE